MPKPSHVKSHGVHYTPPELARFLAEVTARAMGSAAEELQVLDPACGTGGLLAAFAGAVPAPNRAGLILTGFDRDGAALEQAGRLLSAAGANQCVFEQRDFLSDDADANAGPAYDVIIANPPYVRTQVLGSSQSQALARRFGLKGRVDLYQAFVLAMAERLRPGGTLGLLTSNRFLSIAAGCGVRRLFQNEFEVQAVYDLGDTRLFSAAILPVIVTARKRPCSGRTRGEFHRVYQCRAEQQSGNIRQYSSVLQAVHSDSAGHIQTPEGSFSIERGVLGTHSDPRQPWFLSTPKNAAWLSTLETRRCCTFGEIATIRVGIKTTADHVFIRDDWERLPAELQPEPELLRPLITHEDCLRWKTRTGELRARRVLYPHQVADGRRRPIDLGDYPRAHAYLESHREQLSGRKYIAEAGRAWYEIWVPHRPDHWARPKIVFPDIAESPRFSWDASGAVVNGDCYWMTLKPEVDPRWMALLLAVANSSLATQYYDTRFHNKLYAGRRRFMTQYVAQFPLPNLESATARQITALVEQLTSIGEVSQRDAASLEAMLDDAVWRAFGFDSGDTSER